MRSAGLQARIDEILDAPRAFIRNNIAGIIRYPDSKLILKFKDNAFPYSAEDWEEIQHGGKPLSGQEVLENLEAFFKEFSLSPEAYKVNFCMDSLRLDFDKHETCDMAYECLNNTLSQAKLIEESKAKQKARHR